MGSTKIEVKVNGQAYSGWTSCDVSKSIEDLCGTFSLSTQNSWADANDTPRIKAGDLVSISMVNDKKEEYPVMFGYVDIEVPGFNNNGTFLNISGRDTTCDLVDCTLEDTFEMQGLLPVDIIKKLATEGDITKFAIEVISNLTKEYAPYKQNEINIDSKIAEVIKKVSSHYGFLVYTNEFGELVLEDASVIGESVPTIEEGLNVISASRKYDLSRDYSKIRIVSQDVERPSDTNPSKNEDLNKSGEFVDKNFPRYRPLNIVHTEGTSGTVPTDRASWIKKTIQANAMEISVEMQGWTDSKGIVYKLNNQVACDLPSLGISVVDEYMIKDISFTMSESGGERTKLVLVHANAYNEKGRLDEDEGKDKYSKEAVDYANEKLSQRKMAEGLKK